MSCFYLSQGMNDELLWLRKTEKNDRAMKCSYTQNTIPMYKNKMTDYSTVTDKLPPSCSGY